ncbi:hypothetical protein PF003_g266 [Phytophthora fragariae]|nr:hypothetical protein PF003_g266 [Phytophthora fragariae]
MSTPPTSPPSARPSAEPALPTPPRSGPVPAITTVATPSLLPAATPTATLPAPDATPPAGPATAAPTPVDASPARASARIATRKRKRTADGLVEVRRQKRRLVANKKAATAAAALAFAVPLGPRAAASTSSAPSNPARPSSAPGLGTVCSHELNRATDGGTAGPSAARNEGGESTQGPQGPEDADGEQGGLEGFQDRAVVQWTDPAPDPAQSATPAAVFQPAYASALPPASSLVQPAAASPERGSGRHLTPATAGPFIDVDDSDSQNESFVASLQPVAQSPHVGPTSTITGQHPREAFVPTQRLHRLVCRPRRTRSSTSQSFSASSTQAQPRRRLPRVHRTHPLLPLVLLPTSDYAIRARSSVYTPRRRSRHSFRRIHPVQVRPNPEASSSAEPSVHQPHEAVFLPAPATYSWTLSNDKGVLPPAAIRNQRAADFPPPAHRTRGDFLPAAAHSLAAHRLYPYLLSPAGQDCTPMQFVLRMRLLDCLKFNDSPPILGALK